MIKLLYFASLRETLGSGGESLALSDNIRTAGGLKQHLAARGGAWAEAFGSSQLMVSVNQAMGDAHSPIADGDEVAFFPPVTGG